MQVNPQSYWWKGRSKAFILLSVANSGHVYTCLPFERQIVRSHLKNVDIIYTSFKNRLRQALWPLTSLYALWHRYLPFDNVIEA